MELELAFSARSAASPVFVVVVVEVAD